ncbi:MAG TPA: hypothetical protein VNE63_05030 [Candidatus Acidoferrales bacterium]|nr:hypothetical protein [Candidatus Acidoferrales bacterium]
MQRYQVRKTGSSLSAWRFNHTARHLLQGTNLQIELLAPALVHWSIDNWKTVADVKTTDSGLGLYYVDLPTKKLPSGGKVIFTFFWRDACKWEGANWEVVAVPKNGL